jgi:alpha-mannosidase
MLNQFHDILPGSSIQRVYEEAEALYAEVLAEAGRWPSAAATFTSPAMTAPWFQFALLAAHRPGGDRKWPGGSARARLRLGHPARARHAEDSGGQAASARQTGDGGFFLENELIRATFNQRGEVLAVG